MPQPSIDFRLTGYVGGSTFSRDTVDRQLDARRGCPVVIEIESYGGSLAAGLSIASAFRSHGDVTVRLRGMCASAATIASLGAKKVIIDSNACYLAHKVSVEFFEWASLNSDSMETLIEQLRHTRDDLDTFDRTVARMYADKCNKQASDLLQLMKRETWLDARQALEWGLVDEIRQVVGNPSPRLTNVAAAAMTAIGTPLPPVPVADEPTPFMQRLLRFIDRVISGREPETEAESAPAEETANPNPISDEMNTETPAPEADAPEAQQAPASPSAPSEASETSETSEFAAPSAPSAPSASAELEQLRAENARLREALAHRPAEGSRQVVSARTTAESYTAAYSRSVSGAKNLMDELNKIF